MTDCSICCEKFNNSTCKKVECKGCDIEDAACRKCCQTFILNSNMVIHASKPKTLKRHIT